MDIEEAKRRAASGPLLLLARRGVGIAITLISTVTIARLVSPREYGLANMSVVLFYFAQLFQEFGLSNAIMRKGHISEEEVSFLFWFNLAATVVLSIALAACALPVARFYDEPIVADVILVSIVAFLIDGLSLQHRALMSRDLRFGEIAAIDSITMAVGFLVTLVLAYERHDVWAIVFGGVAQATSVAILYMWRSGWTPGRPRRIAGLRDLLSFGVNSSIFSICIFFADNAATFIIGHFLGPASLGQYSRAFSLYRLPISNLLHPVAQSVMPLMARLRPVPHEYRIVFLDLVTKLCTFLFPVSVLMTFVAVPLIRTMLGARWEEAGICFMLLAPTIATYAMGFCAGDLFVTQNRMNELRTLGMVEGAVRVASLFAGLKFGLPGIALAFTLSNSVMALVKICLAGSKGPVTVKDQFLAAVPALPPALGAVLGCTAIQVLTYEHTLPHAVLVGTQVVAGGVLAFVCGLFFESSRAAMRSIGAVFGVGKLLGLWTRWSVAR